MKILIFRLIISVLPHIREERALLMDSVFLTFREKRLLFFMRFKKKVKPRFDVSQLVSYGLISPNHFSKKSAIGTFDPDGTYSLTDKAVRFRIKRRQDFFRRIITPITVTILTDAVINAARWLWQWLQELP